MTAMHRPWWILHGYEGEQLTDLEGAPDFVFETPLLSVLLLVDVFFRSRGRHAAGGAHSRNTRKAISALRSELQLQDRRGQREVAPAFGQLVQIVRAQQGLPSQDTDKHGPLYKRVGKKEGRSGCVAGCEPLLAYLLREQASASFILFLSRD